MIAANQKNKSTCKWTWNHCSSSSAMHVWGYIYFNSFIRLFCGWSQVKQTNLANTVTVRYWLVQQTMYVVMQHVLSTVVVVWSIYKISQEAPKTSSPVWVIAVVTLSVNQWKWWLIRLRVRIQTQMGWDPRVEAMKYPRRVLLVWDFSVVSFVIASETCVMWYVT